MAKKTVKEDEGSIDVAKQLGNAEHFFEKNKMAIAIIVGAVVVIVGGFFAYTKLYAAPREEQAQSEMFQAQYYLEKDSFNLALNGDSVSKGFLAIIDEYSGTDAANLAKHCAGICYLNQGKFDDALAQLDDYSNSGDLFVDAQNIGLQGDAHMEKGDVDEAIELYKKAADKSDNDFTAPIFLMKAAGALEDKKDYKGALELYERLRDNYSLSREGQEIEKHISRAKILAGV
jgi:predicted negative regulator of RcsB-dependent stress response